MHTRVPRSMILHRLQLLFLAFSRRSINLTLAEGYLFLVNKKEGKPAELDHIFLILRILGIVLSWQSRILCVTLRQES